MPGYLGLGEDVPDDALFVDHVGKPGENKQPEDVWNPAELSYPASFVAEHGEREAMALRDALVRPPWIRAYHSHLGIQFCELLVLVPEGTRLAGAAQGTILGVEDHQPLRRKFL